MKAVVLVGHGMNNSASFLDEVAALVDKESFEVVTVLLSGHGESQPRQAKWDETWVSDMTAAIQKASALSKVRGVPLYFLGFSLSCLVFLNALEKLGVPFDRVVFFSPPLVDSFKFTLLNCLRFLGIRYLPSFNRRQYRAHRFLPISMYHALFRLVRNLSTIKSPFPKNALVFLDKRDEMVSFRPLENWIRRQRLDWRLIPVAVGDSLRVIRHLLCVRANVGSGSFALMKDLTHTFFASGKSIDGELALTPYEHFFLNEQNDEYPMSILLRLVLDGDVDKSRLAQAIDKAQREHPLLRARINGRGFHRRHGLRWLVLSEGFAPTIAWDATESLELSEMDLQAEVGLRVFVRAGKETSTITFQLHHACIDGTGSMQFAKSVLSFYRDPSQVPAPASLAELEKRHVRWDKSWTRDLRLLKKFSAFRADSIASTGFPKKKEPNFIVQKSVPFAVVNSREGSTFNDELLRGLSSTLKEWNRSLGHGTNLRITMPIDLRERSQRTISACNVTGMYFVDFGEERKSIHDEMMLVKKHRLAATFNRFVSVCGSVPYGISYVNRPTKQPNRAQTSTCLTNLGIVDKWWPEASAGLRLKEAFGCAPLRPGTRMTFSFAVRNGILMITVLVDSKFFTRDETAALLERLSDHLSEDA